MPTTIRILLPLFPQNNKEIYFRGYVNIIDDSRIIYITKYTTNNELWAEKQQENEIYGYCGENLPKKVPRRFPNFLDTEQNVTLKINKLLINGNEVNTTSNCILMLYDYNNIKDSQAITETKNNYFTKLVNLIQEEHGRKIDKHVKENIENQQWLASSMFLQHVYNYWKLINWLISSIKRDKKVTVKQGNLILAVIMDILLGYLALQLLTEDKTDITIALMGILEKLINSLYSLLKWLMGAPVGLKLNNAFNKMLGKYFSYHVQLWWLFLDVSGEKMDTILHIYHYIGYLGFTFQTAIVSDLICIATFHSYCIYVYAASFRFGHPLPSPNMTNLFLINGDGNWETNGASIACSKHRHWFKSYRLFNIQISGLIALLRLFVGRKYNPLRGGIDSCEYTNQELFVGTVAFTILLLLLPTTTLYYIVFTVFRVLSLSVQFLLAKLIYMIQTLPLYVVTLWLTHSPKVTGNILMEVISQEENTPLILRIKLLKKTIPELVNIFKPPVEVPNQVEWTNLVSNVLVGKQIV